MTDLAIAAASTSHTRLVEILVAGCGGHATETLVPALASTGRIRIVGFCDLDITRAEDLQHRYAARYAGRDLHQLISHVQPDAVVMAGPPAMHVDGGLHALEAGCHVFVEKPPAESTAGLQKLASAAADAGRVGMVGHNLRHTAAWRRLQEQIKPAEVASLVVGYHASGPTGPRWGLSPLEAFVLSHVVHVLDLFNAIFGPAAATFHHIADAGNGRFALTSQWEATSGAIGTAVVSTCAPRLDWNVQLVTTDGTLARITSPRDLEIQNPRGPGEWSAGQRDHWKARALDAGYDSAGYGTELHHFLDAITRGTAPAPTFADELAVYQAIDDLYAQIDLPRNPPR